MNYLGGLGLQRAYYDIRVPDDGTVTFYRDIKLKMGFGVVHCCYYDKIYRQLIENTKMPFLYLRRLLMRRD